MAKELEFGFRGKPLDVVSGPISVETLSNLEEKVSEVEGSQQLHDGWYYAPHAQSTHLGTGERRNLPFSSRVFTLPKTHIIRHQDDLELGQLQFYAWVLSFITGQRLSATEAGFLDSTPIHSGTLNDFVLLGDSLQKSLLLAEHFWRQNDANRVQIARVEAAIHALFVAQNPKSLQFERFLYLYTALDACFAILRDGVAGQVSRITHQERTKWMCDQFAMPVPNWADPSNINGAEIAGMRNPTIHEGLYMGEPMGFAIEGRGTPRNLNLQMQALICRLLVAILGGASSAYVTSEVTSRQNHGLQLS